MKISKSLLIAEENKKTETVHQNDPKILYRIVYNSKQGEPIFEQSITECSDHIHKKLEKLVSFCLQISVVLVNSVIRKLYKRVTGQRIRYLFLNKNWKHFSLKKNKQKRKKFSKKFENFTLFFVQ